MMRVFAISDLHNYFPEPPECELLLLGGDYAPTRNLDMQRRFFTGPFTDYLKKCKEKCKYIVGIAGNHDFVLEADPTLGPSLPWIYLQDSEIELESIRVYGTPWTPMFYNWAFMASEDELKEKFSKIPKGLDIVLSHGPAYRMLDKSAAGIYTGSKSLREKLDEVKPDSLVCGHIHEGRGISERNGTRYFNVSYVDVNYDPRYGYVFIPISVRASVS